MKKIDCQILVNAQDANTVTKFSDFAQGGLCDWCTGDLSI